MATFIFNIKLDERVKFKILQNIHLGIFFLFFGTDYYESENVASKLRKITIVENHERMHELSVERDRVLMTATTSSTRPRPHTHAMTRSTTYSYSNTYSDSKPSSVTTTGTASNPTSRTSS